MVIYAVLKYMPCNYGGDGDCGGKPSTPASNSDEVKTPYMSGGWSRASVTSYRITRSGGDLGTDGAGGKGEEGRGTGEGVGERLRSAALSRFGIDSLPSLRRGTGKRGKEKRKKKRNM